LRFHHSDVWQMNYRVITGAADAWTSLAFAPLFWVEKRSGTLNVQDNLRFHAFKSYGSLVMWGVLISYILFLVSYALILYLVLKGLTCFRYLEVKDATVPKTISI